MRAYHPNTCPMPKPERRSNRWDEVVKAIACGYVVELTTPTDFADSAELHRQRSMPVAACRRAGLAVATRTTDNADGSTSLWLYAKEVQP